tara:strand:- start:3719 stop:4090 length:372 start_codon:yes stop_codon:yes gene_type:complete
MIERYLIILKLPKRIFREHISIINEQIINKIPPYNLNPFSNNEFSPITEIGTQITAVRPPILERVVELNTARSGRIPAQNKATTTGVNTLSGSILFVKIGIKHQIAVKNKIIPDKKDKFSILF